MRTCKGAFLAGLLLALGAVAGPAQTADEAAEKLAAQKKAGAAAWEAVEVGPAAFLETKHLLIYAPKAQEKRLKAVGALLERYHDLAADKDVLAFDSKGAEAYPGKVTVYLFAERDQLSAFARRVEKRRPRASDTGSFMADDDKLHTAAAPLKGISAEARAGEGLAALLLTRKAGKNAPLPDWLVAGFGRATSYRVSPREKFVLEDRKLARALAGKRKPADIWGGVLDSEETDALQGSLADFLAYGPGRPRFRKLVAAFQPEEEKKSKTTAEALEAAGMSASKIEKTWQAWAYKMR